MLRTRTLNFRKQHHANSAKVGRCFSKSYNKEKKLLEAFPFPIIADEKRELIERLGMTDPNELNADGLPMSARAVFIIGPDKRLKLSLLYPASTGRNFEYVKSHFAATNNTKIV